MNKKELSDFILLRDELDREKYFEEHINDQTNINYLKGYSKKMSKRNDIDRQERNYYRACCEYRIKELRK